MGGPKHKGFQSECKKGNPTNIHCAITAKSHFAITAKGKLSNMTNLHTLYSNSSEPCLTSFHFPNHAQQVANSQPPACRHGWQVYHAFKTHTHTHKHAHVESTTHVRNATCPEETLGQKGVQMQLSPISNAAEVFTT